MSADAATEQTQDQQRQEEALEKLSAKLAKTADVGALKEIVDQFYRDAVDLRAKNRELTKDLAAAKGKVKDGDLILSGDDAKHVAAIQKLGVPLKDVATQLEAGKTAITENQGYKQSDVAAQAAELLAWNPKILARLVRMEGLTLDFAEEVDAEAEPDASGKRPKKRVPVVISADEDEDPVPLDEYVTEHLGDFRDALAGAEAARKSDREAPVPEPTRMIRQRSGEQGRGKGASEVELDAQLRKRHSFHV